MRHTLVKTATKHSTDLIAWSGISRPNIANNNNTLALPVMNHSHWGQFYKKHIKRGHQLPSSSSSVDPTLPSTSGHKDQAPKRLALLSTSSSSKRSRTESPFSFGPNRQKKIWRDDESTTLTKLPDDVQNIFSATGRSYAQMLEVIQHWARSLFFVLQHKLALLIGQLSYLQSSSLNQIHGKLFLPSHS